MSISRIDLTTSGPNFSRIAWGAWRLADSRLTSRNIIDIVGGALEMGITTVDHADIYGGYSCETMFGDALASEPGLRKQLQIVTKCGIKLVSPNRPAHHLNHYDTTRAHIVASLENSLRELRVDRVDLLLIHRPDPLMAADEVAQAFVELKQAGKVVHFGVSNFLPHQFDLLASRLSFPLVTNQVQISVLHLDAIADGTLDQCQRLRIAPMAWSPLHGGRLLTGRDERPVRMRHLLESIAQKHGATIEQVALAWILMLPSKPLVVSGTTNLERLRSYAASENVKLTREQWFEILVTSQGHGVP